MCGVPDWVRQVLRNMDFGPSDTCWTWNDNTRTRPWATGPDGESIPAARAIWAIFFGVLLDDVEVHHRCRHPWCVNPDHLEALTVAEHHAEHRPAIPEFCVNGHRLDHKNLGIYRRPDGRTRWQCRICNRDRMRRRAARSPAAPGGVA